MRSRSDRRWWLDRVAPSALGLVAGLLCARCGADHVNAPPAPAPVVKVMCPSPQTTMPVFFQLLQDPSQPLEGFREVVVALAAGQSVTGNPLGNLLQDVSRGLVSFANDPDESSAGRCLSLPPNLPLCDVDTPAAPCENRLCDLRRALDFGVRDQAATPALQDLTPLIGDVLGYMSNSGAAATGTTHYELIDVFHRSSENEALCSPANLIEVIDGIILYARQSVSCQPEDSCPGGIQALAELKALLADPEIQSFLHTYIQTGATGQGRAAFQALGQFVENDFANMPNDSHYFDGLQTLVNDIDSFLENDPKYANLETEINNLAALGQDFLNPARPNAIAVQLKAVVYCISVIDTTGELTGAIYDLLTLPASSTTGLNLVQLVGDIQAVAVLDVNGVLMSALHSVLHSLFDNPMDTEDLRVFLVQVLTVDNASIIIPPLITMINDGVVQELVTLIDDLLYGCQGAAAQ